MNRSLFESFDWKKIIHELEEELYNQQVLSFEDARTLEQKSLVTRTILKIIRPVVWKWYRNK